MYFKMFLIYRLQTSINPVVVVEDLIQFFKWKDKYVQTFDLYFGKPLLNKVYCKVTLQANKQTSSRLMQKTSDTGTKWSAEGLWRLQ